MSEYILYLTRPQFPDELPAKVRIYSSDPNRYYAGAEIKIQGVTYIVRMWDIAKPHPRIKKVNGRWVVEYTRLWDSERNYQNPNYREEVILALGHCAKLNPKDPQYPSILLRDLAP